MSVRGARFLPDESLQFVAIDYLCRVCASGGTRTALLRHAVSTTHERFEDERTHFAGTSAVGEERVQDGPAPLEGLHHPPGHWRYKLTCPRCGQTPEFRHERLDSALRAVYAPGRRGVIEYEV